MVLGRGKPRTARLKELKRFLIITIKFGHF